MAKMTKELVLITDNRKHYESLFNDDSGIYMTSNEYDALVWNEELFETNNLTYYMHKKEQYAASYDAMNMAW